ncbi:hypothetical protein EV363DRAFT_1180824 [Boletus edulis]|nr:hypothetical protein EV363DRAFT_1180824 [Boletus edulis]
MFSRVVAVHFAHRIRVSYCNGFWSHCIPVYRKHLVPPNLQPHHSYDSFRLYYVNKFADHHTFKIAS